MTNLEQAKMQRNKATDNYLSSNAAVFASDNVLIALAAKAKTNFATAEASAALASVDNKGYSAEKVTAKNNASVAASTLAASAQLKLEAIGKHSTSVTLHDAESYYNAPSDAIASARLQEAHDIMAANLNDLKPDYVTDAELTSLQALIDKFAHTAGSSASVNQSSPSLTKQFKADLKVTDTDIADIQKRAKKYQLTNTKFYDGLMNVTEIPAVAVRHTSVEITVTDENGDPLEDVAATLATSKETPLSDLNGILHFDKISRAGQVILTLKKPGYKDVRTYIHVVSAQTNPFSFTLDKI